MSITNKLTPHKPLYAAYYQFDDDEPQEIMTMEEPKMEIILRDPGGHMTFTSKSKKVFKLMLVKI